MSSRKRWLIGAGAATAVVVATLLAAFAYSGWSVSESTLDLLASNDALVVIESHLIQNHGRWPAGRDDLSRTVTKVFGPGAPPIQTRLDQRVEFDWNLDLAAFAAANTPEKRAAFHPYRLRSGTVIPPGPAENIHPLITRPYPR